MASTRNNNTYGNYYIEQKRSIDINNYLLSPYTAVIDRPTQAGNGLLGGRIHSSQLSTNNIDIESFLFGIQSTNLLKPMNILTPEIVCTNETTNMYNKKPTIIPPPLKINKNRPQFD